MKNNGIKNNDILGLPIENSSKELETINLNETQLKIFNAIYLTARTKSEISAIIRVKEKTVANQLVKIGRKLKHHVLLKIPDNKIEGHYYVIRPKPSNIELPPKIYNYRLSATHPYLIVNLPKTKSGYWTLYPLGDLHYGSEQCDYEAVGKVLEIIKRDKTAIVLLMGDLAENALKDSVGTEVYSQIMPPQEQYESLYEMLVPISDKIIAALGGNHGYRTTKSAYIDPDELLAEALQVPYFQGFLYLDIIAENDRWEILAGHGRSASSTITGRINAIKKRSYFHSADIYLMGHVHDQQSFWDIEVCRDPQTCQLYERRRSYVLCGGFRKPYQGYANIKEYAPLLVGLPRIKLLISKDKPNPKIQSNYVVEIGSGAYKGIWQ